MREMLICVNAQFSEFQNILRRVLVIGISWTTVRYMLGEVQYGGRVTDDFDKRLLNTFCRVWFQETMFTDSFRFYQGYSIPKHPQLPDIMNHILELPSVDTPEVFGLHPNADITYQTKTAVDILNTILNIQPKDSAASTTMRFRTALGSTSSL